MSTDMALVDPDQENGWTLVSRSRNVNSFADVVHAPRFFYHASNPPGIHRDCPAQSTVAVTAVFDHLQFPEEGNNEAANPLPATGPREIELQE